jgi:hypothetical protein
LMDEVEVVARAMIEDMFAPHELPIDGWLLERYRLTAKCALAAIAPLRQTEREREWRPIGTAPRDGTSIIVWTAYGTITLAEWTGDQFYPWKGSDDEYAEHVITHWMSLPPPPTQEPHRATSSDAAREEGDRPKPGEPGDG